VKNKNLIITGSTRGLGLAYANYFSSKGYNLFLTDISEKACEAFNTGTTLDKILTKLRSFGGKVHYQSADLTDQKNANDIIAEAKIKFNSIDGLIANAGGDISGSDARASGGKASNNTFMIQYEEFNNIFDRNFKTCLHTLRSVVPVMKEQKYGKIITVSSINASFGVSKETTYSIAKSAIVQLSRSLAKELREFNINVNCIMPGPVRTERFLSTVKDRHKHDTQLLDNKEGLMRIAETEDICPVVEFLISSNSNFISGEVIKIDGGLFPQPV
tara:strand:- start:2257 stop:3075 length:819 start_codon:yes stop_codon:yes gene_type:complete